MKKRSGGWGAGRGGRPEAAAWTSVVVWMSLLSAGLCAGCAAGRPGGDVPDDRHTIASRQRPTASAGLFRDIAHQAGIDFVQGHGGRTKLNILETIGSGCAFLDYDGDGWPDILLVGQPSCALYHNRGDGTFENVTNRACLSATGHWLGCAVGDYDADGHPDFYISGYGCGALYHNRGDGTFADVTANSGIRPRGWETSCAFIAANGEGPLDLYVGRYVGFGPRSRQFCYEPLGVPAPCGPDRYSPEFGTYYRNRGTRFEDATAAFGLGGQSGKCLGAAVAYGGPGVRLALSNDLMPGNLFLLRREPGANRFQDISSTSGVAFDFRGAAHAGMGTDWGDYNQDGQLDLVVTTFRDEPTSLYTGQDGIHFSDQGVSAGLGAPTTPYVGFGVRFFDYDNDGRLDLVIANGHVNAGLDAADRAQSHAEPLQLFHNNSNAVYTLVGPADAGDPFTKPMVGRGLATADYDRDGGLDVLVMDGEGRARLLHNQCPRRGHWIEFDLEPWHGNGGAEGAVVRLQTGRQRLLRSVSTSGSYLSANPTRVHFGLGAASAAGPVIIDWPDGKTQTIARLAADRIWRVREERPASVAAEVARPT